MFRNFTLHYLLSLSWHISYIFSIVKYVSWTSMSGMKNFLWPKIIKSLTVERHLLYQSAGLQSIHLTKKVQWSQYWVCDNHSHNRGWYGLKFQTLRFTLKYYCLCLTGWTMSQLLSSDLRWSVRKISRHV